MYQLDSEEFLALAQQILDNDINIGDNIGKKTISSTYTHSDLKELFELPDTMATISSWAAIT